MSNGAWKQKSKGQEVVLNNYKKNGSCGGKDGQRSQDSVTLDLACLAIFVFLIIILAV